MRTTIAVGLLAAYTALIALASTDLQETIAQAISTSLKSISLLTGGGGSFPFGLTAASPNDGWHAWVERKRKTHVPTKCPACGHWAIWVPKKKRTKKTVDTESSD